jgi:hypothetical protein
MEVHSSPRLQGPERSTSRRRVFTLDHANRTLPFVKRVVADIVKQHRKVCALEDKCHIRRPSVSREDHERIRDQYKVELEKLRWLADELSNVGCRLRDWQRGIIDFRSVYQGREIELCWCLGQERVEYWHELDEGFPCRRLIDDGFSAELTHSDLVESGAEPVA